MLLFPQLHMPQQLFSFFTKRTWAIHDLSWFMLEMKLFPEELQCPRWRGDRNSLETDFKFCVLSCMQMCSVCSSAQRSHCEVRYSLLLATIPHHRERWVGWLRPMARMASKPFLPPSGSGLASSALCLSIPALLLALFSILLAGVI